MPQLYADFARGGVNLRFGHFYSILGYEQVPAIGNFFYTHSFSMQFSPFTFTGFLGSWEAERPAHDLRRHPQRLEQLLRPDANHRPLGGAATATIPAPAARPPSSAAWTSPAPTSTQTLSIMTTTGNERTTARHSGRGRLARGQPFADQHGLHQPAHRPAHLGVSKRQRLAVQRRRHPRQRRPAGRPRPVVFVRQLPVLGVQRAVGGGHAAGVLPRQQRLHHLGPDPQRERAGQPRLLGGRLRRQLLGADLRAQLLSTATTS